MEQKMSVKITGLNKLNRKLKSFEKKATAIDGKNQVSLNELLAPSFLGRYTKFVTFNEFEEKMLENGFSVQSQRDFENLPEKEWNSFIMLNTQFSSWNDLLKKARTEQVKRELGF